MQDSFFSQIKRVKGCLSGLTTMYMRGNLRIICLMDSANLHGLMAEYIKETGKIIK